MVIRHAEICYLALVQMLYNAARFFVRHQVPLQDLLLLLLVVLNDVIAPEAGRGPRLF